MATIAIPTTAFTTIPNTVVGAPAVQLATINPAPMGIAATDLTPFLGVAAVINQALVDNDNIPTPAVTTQALTPNFHFLDETVNVGGTVNGDVFEGKATAVGDQFIDLTPDNLLIDALNPNVFIKSGTGNDVLAAASGRNILSAGSGSNVEIAGSVGVGSDTLISDARTASAFTTIFNMGSGDDAVMLGIVPANYTFSVTDTLQGVTIDMVRTTPPATGDKLSAELNIAGFHTSDFGSKLTVGVSTTAGGVPYLFVHAT